MRDIVLQIRLNERERYNLCQLAESDQITLAEWLRMVICDADNLSN